MLRLEIPSGLRLVQGDLVASKANLLVASEANLREASAASRREVLEARKQECEVGFIVRFRGLEPPAFVTIMWWCKRAGISFLVSCQVPRRAASAKVQPDLSVVVLVVEARCVG